MNKIMNRTVANIGLNLKKHSPEILIVAGIGCIVVGAVLACKSSMKLEEVLDKNKEEIDDVLKNKPNDTKAQAEVYTKSVLKVARLYGPSVCILGSGIGMVVGSHSILSTRNIGLTTAYNTLDKAYSNYRKRVKETVGEEKEKEIKNKGKDLGINIKESDGTYECDCEVSDYARTFDSSCNGWINDTSTVDMFIDCQERYANNLLHARGHVFLNEVYDMFGFPRTKEGSVVGWVDNSKEGDNYIFFERLKGVENDEIKVNEEDAPFRIDSYVVIDFNVDGVIYDKI